MLSWVYVYLSRNPKALASLRKELHNIFGPGTESEEIALKIVMNPKLINQLEYTLAVIRETLRLEPPAQMVWTTEKPYPLSTHLGTSHVLEKGTMILSNIYQMAHDPQIRGQDAEEFKPERFMNGTIPSSFMSFSKWPRDYIGINLAYLEVWSYRNWS